MKLIRWNNWKRILGISSLICVAGNTFALEVTNQNNPLPQSQTATSIVPPDTDLSPTNILAKSKEAYASLSTYRDTGTSSLEMNGPSSTTTFFEMLGARTCYLIEMTNLNTHMTQRYWSDGLNNYHQMGAMKPTNFELLDLNMNLTSVSHESVIPGIYFNLNPRNLFVTIKLMSPNGLVRLHDETIEGVDCYTLATTVVRREEKIWIGKKDFLIRRYRHFYGVVETHENIVVNAEYKRENFTPSNTNDVSRPQRVLRRQ